MSARRTPSLSELPAPPPSRKGWPWTEGTPGPDLPEGEVPAVTLVTPSFGQGEFLEATIRSVLLQSYPRLEYFVMDGGSSDGSVEIIRKYEPWLSGWVSEKDRGQSHAINKGLARATGEVAGWVNSDDRLLPGALRGLARAHARRPDAVAWAASGQTVGPRGEVIFPRVEPRGLTRDGIADWGVTGLVCQPACLFSRRAAADAGGVDERYHYALDMDLWLRLATSGRFEVVDAIWAQETRHPAAKTLAQRGRLLAEIHLVQMRQGFDALCVQRLGEELADYEVLKRGSWAARLKHGVYLLAHPILERLRARSRSRGEAT